MFFKKDKAECDYCKKNRPVRQIAWDEDKLFCSKRCLKKHRKEEAAKAEHLEEH